MLAQMQRQKLTEIKDMARDTHNAQTVDNMETCKSRHGFDVHWHKHLSDVPKEFTFFIAHEFFDALPIHKFQVRFTI